MANTSKLAPVSDRDIFYYRQRTKNRFFEALTAFFAEEAERRGITQRDIAECLRRDPGQISRWLNSPSNITVESISDLLLSLGAELDPTIGKFSERAQPNEMHPLIAQLNATRVTMQSENPKPRKLFEFETQTRTNSNDQASVKAA